MIWSAAPTRLMEIKTTRPTCGDHCLVKTIISATVVSSARLSATDSVNSVTRSRSRNSRAPAYFRAVTDLPGVSRSFRRSSKLEQTLVNCGTKRGEDSACQLRAYRRRMACRKPATEHVVPRRQNKGKRYTQQCRQAMLTTPSTSFRTKGLSRRSNPPRLSPSAQSR